MLRGGRGGGVVPVAVAWSSSAGSKRRFPRWVGPLLITGTATGELWLSGEQR